jgi:hypothetical protein
MLYKVLLPYQRCLDGYFMSFSAPVELGHNYAAHNPTPQEQKITMKQPSIHH